jgi:hypothetical protein
VLRLVALGYTNAEIAAELYLSVPTGRVAWKSSICKTAPNWSKRRWNTVCSNNRLSGFPRQNNLLIPDTKAGFACYTAVAK